MKKLDDRTLTQTRKRAILEIYNYMCVYCFGDAEQIDHIIPWSYKHDDSNENLVACCWLCNLIASNKVFKNLSKKQTYVREKRLEFFKKNRLSIWTIAEINELGKNLRSKIKNAVIIVDTDELKYATARKLEEEGFKVTTDASLE